MELQTRILDWTIPQWCIALGEHDGHALITEKDIEEMMGSGLHPAYRLSARMKDAWKAWQARHSFPPGKSPIILEA